MYRDFADPQLEYRKDSRLKKEDVILVEAWIKKQYHLPKMTEMKIIQFLNSNYYNTEETKRSIENYYNTRSLCPEFFAGRNPEDDDELQVGLKTNLITILPVHTKENYPILLVKIMDVAPERYDLNQAFKIIDMVTSLTQMQMGTSPGQILVMDAEDFTLGHFVRCNINAVRKFIFYIQEACPIRLKAVHVLNTSSVTEKFASLARPFIKKNAYEICFHKTVEGLESFIPKEGLPMELGGTAGTCRELQEKMIQNLRDHHQYFVEEEKEISTESKRVGNSKSPMEMFGIEGSFKKLEFD